MERARPFRQVAQGVIGYRDALIWENVLELLQGGIKQLAFVTENWRDFAVNQEKRNVLHPDLLRDLEGLNLSSERIKLYQNLSTFNDECILPFFDKLEDVRRQLSTNQFPRLNARSVIERHLPELIYGVRLGKYAKLLSGKYADARISGVLDIPGYKVEHVYRLPSGDFLARIDAEIACQLKAIIPYVEIGDWIIAGEEEISAKNVDVFQIERAEIETRSYVIRVEIDLSFNPDSGEVTGIELKRLWIGNMGVPFDSSSRNLH